MDILRAWQATRCADWRYVFNEYSIYLDWLFPVFIYFIDPAASSTRSTPIEPQPRSSQVCGSPVPPSHQALISKQESSKVHATGEEHHGSKFCPTLTNEESEEEEEVEGAESNTSRTNVSLTIVILIFGLTMFRMWADIQRRASHFFKIVIFLCVSVIEYAV